MRDAPTRPDQAAPAPDMLGSGRVTFPAAESVTLPSPATASLAALSAQPSRAKRRKRSRLRFLAPLLFMVIPTALTGVYLWGWAADQYSSEIRFSVRRQSPVRPVGEGSGGAAGALAGGNPAIAMLHDGQVVVQYLRSRQAMDDVAQAVDLNTIYARAGEDPIARLTPGSAAEDRLLHWRRFVEPRFDLTSGVVTVDVSAFTPDDALAVARASLTAAERLVDGISSRARQDAVRFSEGSVAESAALLATAREKLADYRNRTAVLSPSLSAGADTGLEAKLREQLSEARGQLAVMRGQYLNPNAPQMKTILDRIGSLENELKAVAARLAGPQGANSATSLASVTTGYAGLEADERIAQSQYERSLASLQMAKAEAAQQSVYIDAFVRPAMAERASWPIRWRMLLEVAAGAFAVWALLSLLGRAVRDHVD